MKKVTGIGGVFFKAEDPKALKDWYARHLGVFMPNPYGGLFEWREKEDPERMGHTVWNPFPADTNYFAPSEKTFMINFRVADLEALLEELRAAGVEVVGEMEVYEYGKFAWVLDPEGNKIELWEPRDREFRKVNGLEG